MNYVDLNMFDKSFFIGMLLSVLWKNICLMYFVDSICNVGSMRSNCLKWICWFGYVWWLYFFSMFCVWFWSCLMWFGVFSFLIFVIVRMKKISFNDFIVINYFLFYYFFYSFYWVLWFVCFSKEYGLKLGVILNLWFDCVE